VSIKFTNGFGGEGLNSLLIQGDFFRIADKKQHHLHGQRTIAAQIKPVFVEIFYVPKSFLSDYFGVLLQAKNK
jgi:hypothetical protein